MGDVADDSADGALDSGVVRFLCWLYKALSAAVLITGTLVMLGWLLRIPWLKGLGPSLATMKANTACGFVALGAALLLLRTNHRRGWVKVLSAAVAVLGAVSAAQELFDWNSGLDEALFVDDAVTSAPGRMSPATALLFILAGLAVWIADDKSPARRRCSEALALAVGLASFLALLGYLYGVRSLYALVPFRSMALHTAMAFLATALAVLLARDDTAATRLFAGRHPGGMLARSLVPVAVVLPVSLGWIRLQGQRAGPYGFEFGLALFAASNVFCFSLVVVLVAAAIGRADRVRRRAQAKLAESEGSLAITLNSIGDGVIATDAAGVVTRINPVAEQLTGWSREVATGRQLADVFRTISESTRQPEEDPVSRVLREGNIVGLANHTLLVSRDGRETAIADSGAPIRSASGRIEGVVLVFRDQTAERKAERTLRDSEARKGAILEAALDSIVSMDHTGAITEFNTAAERTFGHVRSDVIGKPLAELLVPPSLRSRHSEALQRYLVTGKARILGKRVELTALRADGGEFPVEIAIVRPHLDGPPTFTAYIRDISQREKAARELAVSEARFRHLTESGIMGIIITDTEGNVFEANDAFLRIVGYSREDVAAGRVRWTELTPAEWRPQDEDAIAQLGRTGAAKPWEKEYLRQDGTRVPVLVGVAMLDATHSIAFVLDLAEQKRAQDTSARAVATAEREVAHRERAEAALKDTEEQVRQLQKMEAIGTLAGGVAHDFNNIVSVILGYAEFLLEALDTADPLRADVEQIARAGRRAGELTGQLLAFSRQQVLQPRVLSLNDAVSAMAPMIGRLIGEDVELSVVPAPTAGMVFADPSQVEQVLLNLVVNARDAMPGGGRLTIATADVEVDRGYVDKHVDVVAGQYVMLSVSDTGLGMDRATQSRIFEPFFTTKERGKGTGLGLSTVFGIVKQSGGHIWVYSEPGAGTTFKIYFPRMDVDGNAAEPIGVPPAPVGGSETVLLVEDDPQVRALAVRILVQHGYQVLEAGSGADALLLGEQHGAQIHLLLTDVVMPGMSGRQLWERLAAARPGLRVLFMSGYTDDAIVQRGVLTAELAFVQKPLTVATLLTKIRQVLDQAALTSPGGDTGARL